MPARALNGPGYGEPTAPVRITLAPHVGQTNRCIRPPQFL